MDYFNFKVYEEVMASDWTPEQLHGAIGTRFLNKWKGSIVKSRLIAQDYVTNGTCQRIKVPVWRREHCLLARATT
eukprot:10965905-Lingulodinium_polyedra.AAC.1